MVLSAHRYIWHPQFDRFVCSLCQHSKSLPKHKRDRQACSPLKGLFQQLVRAGPSLGHVLWLAPASTESSSLVFCARCGAYAQLRGNALRRRCNPASTQRLLKRIWQGKHPVGKASLEKPYRLTLDPVSRQQGQPEEEEHLQVGPLPLAPVFDEQPGWPPQASLEEEPDFDQQEFFGI